MLLLSYSVSVSYSTQYRVRRAPPESGSDSESAVWWARRARTPGDLNWGRSRLRPGDRCWAAPRLTQAADDMPRRDHGVDRHRLVQAQADAAARSGEILRLAGSVARPGRPGPKNP